ncbi:unnamed protein product [Rotaria socialis]|uniref:Uncharacterized protein n=1 Tax=Rotaria socialis TaxID=392032 RepID=A0A818PJT7_9BILA|nr:unnamed protein product [Rotaria socialis]CAF4773470.1 unnamed protein product [Rotaria socialis]
MAAPANTSICIDEFLRSCSELVPCQGPNHDCHEYEDCCVHHPRCDAFPVCYPVPSFNSQFCPSIIIPNIPANARWQQSGVTVSGGHGSGNATNQLNYPIGIFIDDDQTVVIADQNNHRIIQWKKDDTNGQVIAGGNRQGNQPSQLHSPTDVLIDKQTNSLIICDSGNKRVMLWSRSSGTSYGEILVDKITCFGLCMDDQRYLYISDTAKDEVRRYQMGDKTGTLIAGGTLLGTGSNPLQNPSYIFVDEQYAIYVSDDNHHVMKWNKDATKGSVIAGGNGSGNALTQLSHGEGLFVDKLGTLYVVDYGNQRVVRWIKGANQGTVIAGGKGRGKAANQLSSPFDLSFDQYGNIYVADYGNHRVQRFSLV